MVAACGGSPNTGEAAGSTGGGGAASSGTSATGTGGGAGGAGASDSSGAIPQGTATFSSGSTNPASGPGGTGGGNGFCGTQLTALVRDFKAEHPDFEDYLGEDPGIVKPDLGADGKPVYAGTEGNPSTTGAANFNQWFRDVPGVNVGIPITIELSPAGANVYSYSSDAFFPIDGQGWGNEGNPHNYHFTLELRTRFLYSGGETFKFIGDDDIFTFINGKLVIDLGGVHGALSAEVNLDERAGELGLEKGKIYPLDLFYAERHTIESHFRVDTTISFVDCGTAVPK